MPAGRYRFGYQEVNLHTVVCRCPGTVAEKIKSVSCRTKHLRHDVLDQHTFVHFQLVKHQFPVKVGTDNSTLIESMADEQSGIAHVAFQRGAFFIQFQSDTRLRRIVAAIDDFGITQPKESLRIVTHTGFTLQSGQDNSVPILGG